MTTLAPATAAAGVVPTTPLVLHIPHDSTLIPPDLRHTLLLDDDALQDEVIAMTDSFTSELFDFAQDVPRVTFPVSRLIVDPERFVDDAREPMAARGMGVIYTTTSRGTVLRGMPSADDRAMLLETYYHPHHRALTLAVTAALGAFASCVIIDCHSFPSRARAYELDQFAARLDICLGTDRYHTPQWLTTVVHDAFASEGYSVSENSPYTGSMVPSAHYESDARVASIMIEINRRLYLDEVSGERLAQFEAVCASVHRAMTVIRLAT